MRDAQSAFDQVHRVRRQTRSSPDDVATVLGLVGRDLVLDIVHGGGRRRRRRRRSTLAGRAVELGYDLRLVCRELSRVVRDLLVLSVDPVADRRSGDRGRKRARAAEGAGRALLARGSAARRSTCCRAPSTRFAAPRSRAITSRWRCCGGCICASWCRSRNCLADGMRAAAGRAPRLAARVQPRARTPKPSASAPRIDAGAPPAPRRPQPYRATVADRRRPDQCADRATLAARAAAAARSPSAAPASGELQGRVPRRNRKAKAAFYNTVVAQAQKIDVAGDRVTFTFVPGAPDAARAVRSRTAWLEAIASSIAGRRDDPIGAGAGRVRAAEPAAEAAAPARAAARPTEPALLEARRWPTPPCRRCSTSFPRRSKRSRRSEPHEHTSR